MKKILAVASTIALLVPVFASAAFDDVTLTTDTVLSVNGITLNVSGSSASIESITVNATDFSVTLQSGSNFKVVAPGLEQLSVNTLTGIASDICNSSQSLLSYTPNSSVTVTIAPSTTLCSSTGSGGSGGSTTVSATPATPATATTPAVPATPAAPPVTPATPASGLSTPQIQAILDVLVSFNADADVIARVKTSLEGTTVGSVTSIAVRVFKSNLTVGSLGSEVKALQEFLNAKGYTLATSGAGSPGNETTRFGTATKAALIKYQKAKGITPAVGYFGPKTRAIVEADS
jgi:hypothetical protein